MTTTPLKISMPWREIMTGVQFGTPISSLTSGSYSIAGDLTKNGVQDPKWKSKVRNLESATNPYSFIGTKLTRYVPGKYQIFRYQAANRYRTMTGIGNISVPMIASIDPYLTTSQSVSNQALVAFVKKCKGASRTYRGFVGLGEVLETIRAIRHPLKSLKKGFGDYGRAVERNAKERLRGVRTVGARRRAAAQAVSGTYLEYANGWGPLVRDVDNLANTVARQLEQKTAYTQRIVASVKTDDLLGGKGNALVNTNSLWMYSTWSARREQSCRIVGVVKVSFSEGSSMQKAFGVTPSDFVPAIWELLPLSYVANAFVDITGSLETLGFDPSVLAWCSRSTKTQLKAKLSATGLKVVNSTETLVFGTPSVMEILGTALVRDEPKSFIAWPVLRLPGGDYNWSRLANFTSLFIQFRTHSLNLWKMIG